MVFYMIDQDQYQEIAAGYRYPVSIFKLEAGAVSDYLRATGDNQPFFTNLLQVPPLLVAARALAELARGMHSPAGTVHTTQDLEFRGIVRTSENLTLQAGVENRMDRGELHMLTTGFSVLNNRGETVLAGRITVACRSVEAKWRRSEPLSGEK
jgi:hypothetical protein